MNQWEIHVDVNQGYLHKLQILMVKVIVRFN